MPGSPTAAAGLAPETTSPAGMAARCNLSAETLAETLEESRAFVVAVYSAVCALGLPANCLTAWLTLQQARRGSVLAVYLFCLALCELLYAGTLPLWVVYVQRRHHWALGAWACRATAYIFFCNLYVSILFLCCVSCDRFVAVVYALESRGRRRRRTAVLVSAAVFLLVGLAHYPVFQMEHKDTCFETVPMDGRLALYYYLRFAVGFALPLSVIAVTNHRIFRAIKLSQGLSAAQKAKVKHTAIAVVVIFLVCFAPYHVVLLFKATAFTYYRGDENSVCRFEVRLYTASAVFLCLSTVNSVADPILYVLATDHSRQEVSRIHGKWKLWSTRTEATKLTCSKDSGEMQLPKLLAKGCMFPRSGQPPKSQPGTWASLGTLERLSEESC